MPRSTRGKSSALIVHMARNQRHAPTPAEERLWDALRGRRLGGLKFRRQHPYGRFILDAYCVERQIVVEVDGDIHSDLEQVQYDRERTKCLEADGIRVLRFKNEDVMDNLGQVLGDSTGNHLIPLIQSKNLPLSRKRLLLSGEGAGG